MWDNPSKFLAPSGETVASFRRKDIYSHNSYIPTRGGPTLLSKRAVIMHSTFPSQYYTHPKDTYAYGLGGSFIQQVFRGTP